MRVFSLYFQIYLTVEGKITSLRGFKDHCQHKILENSGLAITNILKFSSSCLACMETDRSQKD